uniref:glia maturation factor gamma-like isoform X1 n=1 Tax=Myxine glutinosa TaxID=7769 RepID=UPI00358E3140
MGDNLVVCDIDPELITRINKFRFRKETTDAAIVMKVEKQRKTIVLDEEYEDISVEDLKDQLPERQPRFVLYSYKYKHDDGRCSYPLCFIFISPQGCKPDLQMMYAGTKNNLVKSAQLTKVFELRSTDEFTEQWLREKLGFFR